MFAWNPLRFGSDFVNIILLVITLFILKDLHPHDTTSICEGNVNTRVHFKTLFTIKKRSSRQAMCCRTGINNLTVLTNLKFRKESNSTMREIRCFINKKKNEITTLILGLQKSRYNGNTPRFGVIWIIANETSITTGMTNITGSKTENRRVGTTVGNSKVVFKALTEFEKKMETGGNREVFGHNSTGVESDIIIKGVDGAFTGIILDVFKGNILYLSQSVEQAR